MYDKIAYLMEPVETQNEYGDVVKGYNYRRIFCDEKSIRQSEFYQAQAVGLRPSLMFEMRNIEYKGEPKMKYNDIEYDIIRTFKKNEDYIELVCQGITNNGG